MSLVLQISDTHFGTEQRPVMRALRRLVIRERPQLLILSGDITQRAQPRQFRNARRFLDSLPVPARLVLPGNHDIPLLNVALRMFAPYANHRREFGHELEPEFEAEDLLVIGVNTTRFWRHVDGTVGAAQLRRVAERLRGATQAQLRIVVTHQPVDVPTPRDEHNLLRGHREAVRTWAEAGADLILGGHIHLPYVRSLKDPQGPLSRRVWCVQAGTALSTRLRRGAPNSVNLIRHSQGDQPPRCRVERWDYLDATDSFETVEDHLLTLDR